MADDLEQYTNHGLLNFNTYCGQVEESASSVGGVQFEVVENELIFPNSQKQMRLSLSETFRHLAFGFFSNSASNADLSRAVNTFPLNGAD